MFYLPFPLASLSALVVGGFFGQVWWLGGAAPGISWEWQFTVGWTAYFIGGYLQWLVLVPRLVSIQAVISRRGCGSA